MASVWDRIRGGIQGGLEGTAGFPQFLNIYGARQAQQELAPQPFQPYDWWGEVYNPLYGAMQSASQEQLTGAKRQLAGTMASRGMLRSPGVGGALESQLTIAAQRDLARQLAGLTSQAGARTAQEYGTYQQQEFQKQLLRSQSWQNMLSGLGGGDLLSQILMQNYGGGNV